MTLNATQFEGDLPASRTLATVNQALHGVKNIAKSIVTNEFDSTESDLRQDEYYHGDLQGSLRTATANPHSTPLPQGGRIPGTPYYRRFAAAERVRNATK